jgi:hypothetical protein
MQKTAIIIILGTALASGCAAGGQANVPSGDVSSEEGVAMVAQNETASVTTVYVQWQGGRRTRLGELRGGATRTFDAPMRGSEVRVAFESAGRDAGLDFGGPAQQDAAYVAVTVGDRLEWTLRSDGSVFYRRLPRD